MNFKFFDVKRNFNIDTVTNGLTNGLDIGSIKRIVLNEQDSLLILSAAKTLWVMKFTDSNYFQFQSIE